MRKIFSLLLCLMLFGPAAARAIDIEGYLPSEVNARARWIDVDGSYTVALEAQMEADAPRRLVRYDADGGVVYDIVLPDVEGNMPEGGVSKIYRLPDGRDALLFLTGIRLSAPKWVLLVSETGDVEEMFPLPAHTADASFFAQGTALLIAQKGNGPDATVASEIAWMDWAGQARFRAEGPEIAYMGLIKAVAEENGRFFFLLSDTQRAYAVCADESGVIWMRAMTKWQPETILPDGEGGLYIAAADASLPCEGALLRLDAQGEVAFLRTVRCDPGVIVSVMLVRDGGLPALFGAQTAHSKGFYRCFQLTFDPAGNAVSLEGRDFTTPLDYSYALRAAGRDADRGEASVYVHANEAVETEEGLLLRSYNIPYGDLKQADDVNVWLE